MLAVLSDGVPDRRTGMRDSLSDDDLERFEAFENSDGVWIQNRVGQTGEFGMRAKDLRGPVESMVKKIRPNPMP